MSLKSLRGCKEKNNLQIMNKNKLPYRYKNIGYGIVIFSLLGMLANKYTINNPIWMLIPKYIILIGLLMVSNSKEKVEDELIASLRMQSYTFAFIAIVISVIITPIFDILFSVYGENIDLNKVQFGGNDWQIISMLLFLQIVFFEILKRRQNEE